MIDLQIAKGQLGRLVIFRLKEKQISRQVGRFTKQIEKIHIGRVEDLLLKIARKKKN